MAKKSNAVSGASTAEQEDWRVDDALRTLQRAGEIVKDAKLMAKVKEKAAEQMADLKVISRQADRLAKAGRISPKQMAKLGR